MCGRSRCALAPEQVQQTAGTDAWVDADRYNPSYNVCPGAATPTVHLNREGQPTLHTMHWGLVPSFTKPDDKPDFWKMFNARCESVAEKPSFRRLLPSKRCLVILEGFYEWKKEGKAKQPYYIHLGGEPMVMAGLYDTWKDAAGEVMHTYTILTCESCKRLQWLHDRMPVILKTKEAQQLWLDTTNPAAASKLHSILGPYEGEDLQWHAVTKSMSNPSFQGPECSAELKKPSMSSFFSPKKAAGTGAGTSAAPKGIEKAEVAAVKEEQAEWGVVAVVKAEERGNEGNEGEAHAMAMPNADEVPSPAEAREAEAATPNTRLGMEGVRGNSQSKKRRAVETEGGGGVKTPPSKKTARPAGQPDISSFFTKPTKK